MTDRRCHAAGALTLSATCASRVALVFFGVLAFACKPSHDGSTPDDAGAAAGMVSSGAGGSALGGVGGSPSLPPGGAAGTQPVAMGGNANDSDASVEAGTDLDAGTPDAGTPEAGSTDCPSTPVVPCSITVSGLPAGDGTYPCSFPASAYYNPLAGQNFTQVNASFGTNGVEVVLGPVLTGDIQTGTFASSNPQVAGLALAMQGGREWTAVPASNPNPQGDYSLTLTCFTKLYVKQGVTYYSMHGSITAHLLPTPSASGTDMVTAEGTF